jgi:ABC-type phosphate transport system substrate-binding protein
MKVAPKLTTSAVLAVALLSACGGESKQSSSSSSSNSTKQPASTTRSVTGTQSTSITVTGSSTAAGLVSATAGEVKATLRAATHHPKVNAPWPISFEVTKASRPLRAKVSYEYLFAGNVVAKRSNYSFTGRFSDLFRWPASAAGYPLIFRAVVTAAGQTLYLDYPVQVLR